MHQFASEPFIKDMFDRMSFATIFETNAYGIRTRQKLLKGIAILHALSILKA